MILRFYHINISIISCIYLIFCYLNYKLSTCINIHFNIVYYTFVNYQIWQQVCLSRSAARLPLLKYVNWFYIVALFKM